MHTASNSNPTAGLLLSLAHTLPGSSPLRRRAARIAGKLNRHHTRAVDTTAAALLASLLTATDSGLAQEADGLIDSSFDD